MCVVENQSSSEASPPGRRVLVAIVTGDVGDRIQQWRQVHDPKQARRLPPHVTLCYWAPQDGLNALEQQVRHAFADPVTVRLGAVKEFDNKEHTFYVEVCDAAPLNTARLRLYDGTHRDLPPLREWTWHVTCVRDSRNRDLDELRRAAAGLYLDTTWRIDTVACLELRGERYEPVATWII
jgi:2'-5' RNA ligase